MGFVSPCPDVLVEQDGHVLTVRLHRPERKNALTHAMYTALYQAMDWAAQASSVRVLVLTGSEACFTAGNDMADFLNDPPTRADSPVMLFLDRLRTFGKPLVAAVCGPAVGVGTTLLLHCDLVYCGRSARLSMPFVSLGLCPEAGSSFLLPRRVGHVRAAQMLMTAEVLDGAQAVDLGLANGLCDDADCLAQAQAMAARIAAMPPASIRLTKELLRRADQAALADQMAVEGDAFRERLGAAEAREAMTAFMEKRAPDFSRFD